MALKDAMVKLMAALTGKKSEIIDVETIVDAELPAEMIDELSNGKGDDE